MSCQCFTTNKTIMSWHFRSLKADAVWLTHKNNLSSKLIIIQCHLHTVFNDWAQMFYGSVGEWVTNNMNGWQPKKPNGWLLGQTISTWQLSLSSEKKSFYSTNSNYREEMICFFSTEMKVKHVVCPFPISGNCSSHYWEKKKKKKKKAAPSMLPGFSVMRIRLSGTTGSPSELPMSAGMRGRQAFSSPSERG